MTTVILKDGESLESALRRFKRACERDGIMQELKRREFYRKPSEIKHEKNRERKRKLYKLREKSEETDLKFDKVSDQE